MAPFGPLDSLPKEPRAAAWYGGTGVAVVLSGRHSGIVAILYVLFTMASGQRAGYKAFG